MKQMKKKAVLAVLFMSMILPKAMPVQYAEAAKKVYIAPYSGTKYHCRKNCRGLSNAKSIKKVTVKYAKNTGRTKCSICY